MLPAEKRNVSQVVVVVLQGFLGSFNVTPLGNWDRLEHILHLRNGVLPVRTVGIVRRVQLRSDDKFSLGLQLLCDHDVNAARYNAYTRCDPVQGMTFSVVHLHDLSLTPVP